MIRLLVIFFFGLISLLGLAWSFMVFTWLIEARKQEILQGAFGSAVQYLTSVAGPIIGIASLAVSLCLSIGFGVAGYLYYKNPHDEPARMV